MAKEKTKKSKSGWLSEEGIPVLVFNTLQQSLHIVFYCLAFEMRLCAKIVEC